MRRLLLAVAVGLSSLMPTGAFAWSLETHLYIAQLVLEDVRDDGKISLCLAGIGKPGIDCSRQYEVPTRVRDALMAYPEAYVAGVLGPDVYPDFITGQVTVHPGVAAPQGWVTHQWLQHLLDRAAKPQDLAFAYGFTGHASGDIFAHSYVNAYAGDIFDLGKHFKDRNEVEIRHYLLERFIAERTPDDWRQLGSASGFTAPHDFVAAELLFSPSVGGQYRAKKVTEFPKLIYVRYQEALWRLRLAESEGPISEARQERARLDVETYRRAAESLSAASEAVALALVSPRPEDRLLGSGGRLDPYGDWLRCWTPVLTVQPSRVTDASCKLIEGYADLKQRYENAIDSDWSKASPATYDAALQGAKALKGVQGVLLEALVASVHRDAATFLKVQRLGGSVTAVTLDQVFAKDQGRQKVVELKGVSALVLKDMGMTAQDARFRPHNFPAVYNSVVLSKLALLDEAGLNEVVTSLGGPKLYAASGAAPYSIVTEGVRSIDGNHQWQHRPLPYPRRAGVDEGWAQRAYGSLGVAGEASAFRLWGNPAARDRVFKVIFKGPLSPNLEAVLAQSAGLPNYPFPACAENPFPSSTDAAGQLQLEDLGCERR